MVRRTSFASLLVSALAVIPPQQAAAGGGGEAFVGGLLGSAIGTAIVNSQQQRQTTTVRERRYVAPRAPAIDSYTRAQNAQIQTALNYFGFPAGVPDGVLGANSRAAIGQYQAYIGSAPTGVLTEYDRALLTSSYDRALVGGPQVAQTMATTGQGTRGLLIAWRQEQMGMPPAVVAAPVAVPVAAPVPAPVATPVATMAAAPAPAPEPVAAVEPEAAVAAAKDAAPPPIAAAATAAPGLPNFLSGAATASMASYCNRVSLATSTNGGFITAAAMSDPTQALGEQFCLARTYAIEQGDSLAGAVQGFSIAEMETQCDAFAPSMTGFQAKLAVQDPAEVRAALQEFVASTGISPTEMSGNARICLGIGYRTDDATVALASAMVLVGLGEEAYDELLGFHLVNGFATPKRTDRGLEWLAAGSQALGGGASPLVSNGADVHAAVVRQAVADLSGTPVVQEAAAPAAPKTLALPMPAASN